MPIQTTTDAIQSVVTHNPDFGDQIYSAIFYILVAGFTAALWIRRKLSKDTLELKKDAVEGDLLQHLEDERDVLKRDKLQIIERLEKVESERNEAVGRVGKLTVEVEHLTKQVKHLESLVEILSNKLDIATTAMQASAIENVKLSTQLDSIKDMFNMKCDSCSYKRFAVEHLPDHRGIDYK